MNEHPRYRIVSEIARGEFATVFKGIDQELGREIAIKQIHPQYLANPAELERFWREAQLLARLEHPYVMTLYDLVRERGWLILELARGSLRQQLAGKPIDVEDLRLTLIYMCQALQFLQKNGIVHGDVKPTNLLLDKNRRVKLGDFGIARRLSHDEGSAVKGTTKYMAPEVISDQFGQVGPHSDLYSLGFAAYELLCGEHFESLFPGLQMFGRDPQVAWMMWHTSSDRRLPEIGRVLEGVPEDLAKVIQRMIEKDPKRRYRDAEQVLFDLKARHEGKDPDAIRAAEEAERQAERAQAQRRRKWALVAIGISLSATVAMAFIPSGGERREASGPRLPVRSVIRRIDLDRGELIVGPEEGATTEAASSAGENATRAPVALRIGERDELTLNGAASSLGDLRPGDELTIREGKDFLMLKATRPEVATTSSPIVRVDRTNSRLELADSTGGALVIDIPDSIPLRLNGRDMRGGRPIRLEDLADGDRATVAWNRQGERNVAVSIDASRITETAGKVERIDGDSRTLWLRIAGEAEPIPFRLASEATLTLNSVATLPGGKTFGLSDVRAGDEVAATHTAEVDSLRVIRTLSTAGIVAAIASDRSSLTVQGDDGNSQIRFTVGPEIVVEETSASGGAPIVRTRDAVRVGDRIEVRHASVDLVDPVAERLILTPVPAPDRWALLIGCDSSGGTGVSPVPHALIDLDAIDAVLTGDYRIDSDRRIRLTNPTKLEVLDAVERLANRVAQGDQLIVYFVGHGFADERREPWMATAEFEPARMSDTGLSLRELLSRLEAIATRQTLLLLETGHESAGEDRRLEPSTAEWVEVLKRSPAHPVSTRVDVFAGNAKGERGVRLGSDRPSLFTAALCRALAGTADSNFDGQVDAAELGSRLPEIVGSLATEHRVTSSTPTRFIPDARPPRLQPNAAPLVLELLAAAESGRYDEAFAATYDRAAAACADQPDADLAFAIVNLKHSRTAEARRLLERVAGRRPDEPSARLALAWQNGLTRRYDDSLTHLRAAAEHLPVGPEHAQPADEAWALSAAGLIGTCCGFATASGSEVGWSDVDLAAFETLAAGWPEPVAEAYRTAKGQVIERHAMLAAERDASEGASRDRLTQQLGRLGAFGELDLATWRERVRTHLTD